MTATGTRTGFCLGGPTVDGPCINLGLIALAIPLTADPWVLHLHVPYLAAVVLLVAAALGRARRLGGGMGGVLLGLYGLYLGFNIWAELR